MKVNKQKNEPEQGVIDFSFGSQQGSQQKRFLRESAAKSVCGMGVDARQGLIQAPRLLQRNLVNKLKAEIVSTSATSTREVIQKHTHTYNFVMLGFNTQGRYKTKHGVASKGSD